MNNDKIIIIGAGVAGLTAAIELEKRGYSPTILEYKSNVGGRVMTDYENGFQFDHGFQVLLTAYPEAQKYLDYDKLNLKTFLPGAMIHESGRSMLFSDPLRKPSTLLSAALSPAGTLLDKWKIWRLTQRLKNKSITEIFHDANSVSTYTYLSQIGLSDRIIQNFFQPFFGGIFLENALQTSSKLFEFIFKMFSEGYAAIPDKGMQEIPNQLAGQLNQTHFFFNTKVLSISDGKVKTDGQEYEYDKVIIATSPESILPKYTSPAMKFQSTTNLYFAIPAHQADAFIDLVPSEKYLTNNVCIISNAANGYASEGKSLLSVSVLGNSDLSESELSVRIIDELVSIYNLDLENFEFLKSYFIPEALPILKEPSMSLSPTEVIYQPDIYLAGDHLLGGSLNGAMVSGRQCVEFMMSEN